MSEIPTKDVGRSPDSGYMPNLTPAISPTSANKTFSLTPAERIHLDIYGYVVLEKVLAKAEVDLLVETILQFEQDYQRDKVPPKSHMFFTSTTWNFFRIDNLPHLASCFREYVTNPKIVGLAEDAVGGSVRLEQSDAHIRRRDLNQPVSENYGWHRGFDPAFSYRSKGLFHCPFVKCLTNLTDLGPDDGGTTVIAGSHKMVDISESLLIDAVRERPELRHQVVAPAGSTLLFFESTIHAGGINRSGKDRLLILGGYTPDFFQPWFDYEPNPEFLGTLSAEEKPFYNGSRKYHWRKMNRDLTDPKV